MKNKNKGAVSGPLSKTILQQFGEDLRVEMAKQNMNLSDLVKACGVSEPTVSGLKNGTVKNVSLETLVKIAKGLGRKIEVQFS